MGNYNSNQNLFLDPWEEIESNNLYFESELYKELSKEHKLFGIKVKAIARKCDDILFYLNNDCDNYALVHLTWKGKSEENPHWPVAKLFSNLEEWKVLHMIPDYIEYYDSHKMFEVLESHKRINNELALFGKMSPCIKLGCYLINKENVEDNYIVKGIETLNYIDKNKVGPNPWVIIEPKITTPNAEEFIGKKYIIGINE
ncbi:MAG: hypothetical protein Q8936_21480 [Bacillota bacterium]|nr:hypothetical protein [Bacillota bacterium]